MIKDKPLSEKVFSNEDMDIIFRDDVAKFISDLLKQIKRRDLKDYVGLGFKGNIFDWIIKRAGEELANHSPQSKTEKLASGIQNHSEDTNTKKKGCGESTGFGNNWKCNENNLCPKCEAKE